MVDYVCVLWDTFKELNYCEVETMQETTDKHKLHYFIGEGSKMQIIQLYCEI